MEKSQVNQDYPVKRIVCSICLIGIAGAVPGVVADWLSWSNGVSFAAMVVVCTALSMVALRENPVNWFRQRPERGRDSRHA